jgi:cell division protein FtsB
MRPAIAIKPWHANIPWRKVSRSLVLVLALFYLAFHAVSGERGLFAWFRETRRLAVLQTELTSVQAQRAVYEKKIRLLSSASLDLDMLDEQSRRVLGVAGADEVVVLDTAKK